MKQILDPARGITALCVLAYCPAPLRCTLRAPFCSVLTALTAPHRSSKFCSIRHVPEKNCSIIDSSIIDSSIIHQPHAHKPMHNCSTIIYHQKFAEPTQERTIIDKCRGLFRHTRPRSDRESMGSRPIAARRSRKRSRLNSP